MPFIKLQGFSGVVPRTGPSQLQSNQAQESFNVKLQSGELRAWRNPVFSYTPLVADVQAIYRMTDAAGDQYWLTWDSDVDVVESPIADSSQNRIYYTGDGVPKKTDASMAMAAGSGAYPRQWLKMGVPAPTGAPTLAATGGTTPTETRAYVYTYVSTFGTVKEESAPSPAATVTCNTSGATVTVSGFTAAPTSGYNITHIRIYRSVTGASSVNYQLVAEIPIATTSYADTVTVVNLGQTLPSLYWTPPPDDMKGLVALPNGILAGFKNNEVWLSEPFYPHAWPDTYVLTTEFPIVGLGVYENTLVVMTTKNPYLITGSHPSAMSQAKLPMQQPCVSKRSIESDQFGVLYASPNGLVAIGPGVQDVITQGLYTRDEWQQLLPETMLGVVYNNMYIGFYLTSDGIKSLVLSRNDTPPLSYLSASATAAFVERSTGAVYTVSSLDNKIYKLDSDDVNSQTYEWKSKMFILSEPTNFGAMKVQGDFEYMQDVDAYNAFVAEIVAYNEALFASVGSQPLAPLNGFMLNEYTLNGSQLKDIPPFGDVRTINVILYADGKEIYSTGITSPDPVRLPANVKAYDWEVKISGNTPVRSFAMATSIGELRQVPQS